MNTFMIVINIFRLLPVLIFYLFSRDKKELLKDVVRWQNYYNYSSKTSKQLFMLLIRHKEFRNLFLFRIKKHKFAVFIFSILFKKRDDIFINCDCVGSGLFLHHGFSSIINAERIGNNCWINQQVTIGATKKGKPSIGNYCKICAGAIIVGPVTIGDNCVIGAGSVVTKNINDGEVWAGNPAHFIRKTEEGDCY